MASWIDSLIGGPKKAKFTWATEPTDRARELVLNALEDARATTMHDRRLGYRASVMMGWRRLVGPWRGDVSEATKDAVALIALHPGASFVPGALHHKAPTVDDDLRNEVSEALFGVDYATWAAEVNAAQSADQDRAMANIRARQAENQRKDQIRRLERELLNKLAEAEYAAPGTVDKMIKAVTK